VSSGLSIAREQFSTNGVYRPRDDPGTVRKQREVRIRCVWIVECQRRRGIDGEDVCLRREVVYDEVAVRSRLVSQESNYRHQQRREGGDQDDHHDLALDRASDASFHSFIVLRLYFRTLAALPGIRR